MPEENAITELKHTVIWRYVKAANYRDLFQNFDQFHLWAIPSDKKNIWIEHFGRFWFSYPRALSEGLCGEGTYPSANLDPKLICQNFAKVLNLSDKEAAFRYDQFLAFDSTRLRNAIEWLTRLIGVSCWTTNSPDSGEMWKYIESDDGVAIRTSVSSLQDALNMACQGPIRRSRPNAVKLGYIDYDRNLIYEDGYRGLLSHTDKRWDDENEIRFIARSINFPDPDFFKVKIANDLGEL